MILTEESQEFVARKKRSVILRISRRLSLSFGQEFFLTKVRETSFQVIDLRFNTYPGREKEREIKPVTAFIEGRCERHSETLDS